MAVRLTTTKQSAVERGIKVCVYSAAGAGKTTLCSTTGEPTVIISAEAGLLSLRKHDIPVIEVSTIEDVHEAYRFISESSDAKDFRWVCLDSVTEIAEVVLAAEKAATRDPRRAYGELADRMMELLRAFRDIPERNVYMSSKMEKQKDEGTGAMLYSPSMPGQRLGQQLPYLFDFLFALRVEKDSEGNLSRWLQTQPDLQWTAKDRSGELDPFEAPSLAAIAAKIHQPKE